MISSRLCLTCWSRSHRIKRSPLSPPMGPMTRADAIMRSLPGAPRPSSLRARLRRFGSQHDSGRHRAKRSRESIQLSRSRLLAKPDRPSPPQPRRDEDGLRQTPRPGPHGEGLRPAGCEAPNPDRCAQSLHSTWHTYHRARRISSSGERKKRPSPDLCNSAARPSSLLYYSTRTAGRGGVSWRGVKRFDGKRKKKGRPTVFDAFKLIGWRLGCPVQPRAFGCVYRPRISDPRIGAYALG